VKIAVGDLVTYSAPYAEYLFSVGLSPKEIKRTVYLVVCILDPPDEGLLIETLDRNGSMSKFYDKDLKVFHEK